MSDAIFGSRFVGIREPGWHHLGHTVTQEQLDANGGTFTTVEGFKLAGMTYQFVTVPLGYDLPDGTRIVDTSRVAILREPTQDDPEWATMGIVTSDYGYLQNQQIAEGLDAIAKETGWTFETCGALYRGGTIFSTLKVGQKSIFGDRHDLYFILSDGKATGRGLKIDVADVRVVCQNTLRFAEDKSIQSIKIQHNQDVASNFQFWTGFIGQMEKSLDANFSKLADLAKVKITDEQAKEIFDTAYPLPKKNPRAKMAESVETMDMPASMKSEALAKLQAGVIHYEFWLDLTKKRREGCMELYHRFNAGEEQGAKDSQGMTKKALNAVKETPYAALQAVTELVDYGGRQGANVAAYSGLFGEGATIKDRAYAAASKLVQSN